MDPTPPDGSEPSRSSYEDLSDIVVPTPVPAEPRRTAIVSMAALVLFVSALMNGIVVVALSPEGASLAISAALAVAQALAAVLVMLLVPAGRPLGIALGILGIGTGLVVAGGGSAVSGLITVALNGYVIYALAASGPSFRRG